MGPTPARAVKSSKQLPEISRNSHSDGFHHTLLDTRGWCEETAPLLGRAVSPKLYSPHKRVMAMLLLVQRHSKWATSCLEQTKTLPLLGSFGLSQIQCKQPPCLLSPL